MARRMRLDGLSDETVALLIGINYTGSANQLNGCINDVFTMNEALPYARKYMMTDEYRGEYYPTCNNIRRQIKKLIEMSWTSHKRFLIYYSGHGSYIRDRDGDELDGNDECMIGIDMKYILDDELKSLLLEFSPSSNIMFITDCCHSGSILDLSINYITPNIIERQNNVSSMAKIIHISGCRDGQTSADVFNREENEYGGALSIELMKALKRKTSLFDTWTQCKVALKQKGYTQIPCISSSYLIDGNESFGSFLNC